MYSGLYGSPGKERMAMGIGGGYLQIKVFYFLSTKNTGKMARAQGKHRDLGINWSVATLL